MLCVGSWFEKQTFKKDCVSKIQVTDLSFFLVSIDGVVTTNVGLFQLNVTKTKVRSTINIKLSQQPLVVSNANI